jgi:hypothetical protein
MAAGKNGQKDYRFIAVPNCVQRRPAKLCDTIRGEEKQPREMPERLRG